MKQFLDFKEDIHKCSKCGLCQAECPIYKITGNDCSVSRGIFIMLQGVINGELRMSKTINRYLDLCLKCGACSKFCPSGIDIVDIIISAKHEYLKQSLLEKIKSFVQKYLIFGFIPNFINIFTQKIKSKNFEHKVIYFGGCGNKLKGNKSTVKILNSIGIEVLTPTFNCCGVPYLTRGDICEFKKSIKNFIKIIKKYNINEIITTCASCEKTLKDYSKWCDEDDKKILDSLVFKNIYEYLREKKVVFELKTKKSITYHKPCNIGNFDDILWLLNNTKNLQYIEMNDYDKCCGLNGIAKFKEYKIMCNIFKSKINNIKKTNTKIVTTSCLGCEIALKSYSLRNYKVLDLIDFISNNI
ncbi:(Fe-S)-binding protein [bacterium]|nr:(Fe-S)-binding protein [bacterium]